MRIEKQTVTSNKQIVARVVPFHSAIISSLRVDTLGPVKTAKHEDDVPGQECRGENQAIR